MSNMIGHVNIPALHTKTYLKSPYIFSFSLSLSVHIDSINYICRNYVWLTRLWQPPLVQNAWHCTNSVNSEVIKIGSNILCVHLDEVTAIDS